MACAAGRVGVGSARAGVGVKAAGRTLTVGELREALAGLGDNVPVMAGTRCASIMEVEADASTVLFFGPDEEESAAWEEFILGIAEGDYSNIPEVRRAARAMMGMDGSE